MENHLLCFGDNVCPLGLYLVRFVCSCVFLCELNSVPQPATSLLLAVGFQDYLRVIFKLALADWHCLDRHPVEALELMHQALAVLPDETARPWQWRIAVMLARCHRLLRQVDVARTDLEKARAIIETLRSNLDPGVSPDRFARVTRAFDEEWAEVYGP